MEQKIEPYDFGIELGPTDQGAFQDCVIIQYFWNGPSDGPVGYPHGFPASPEVIVGRFWSIPSSGDDLAHPGQKSFEITNGAPKKPGKP